MMSMKKYLLSFFGGNVDLRYANRGKADKAAEERSSAAWAEWMGGLVKAKKLVTGYPLESDGKRVSPGGTEDRHFADDTEGGFVVIEAESLDEAAAFASSSPIIKNGGFVLVRPCGELK
jgi:hypothetical protein